jgi:cell division protein FtsI/penicillin-binding protein 2
LNTGSTQALRLLGDSSTEITQVGKERLYEYYFNKFWLGKYTGIEIAESDGLIIPPSSADGTNARYANMTFGQGLNITAIQLLSGFSSVINGGDYYTPTVVAGEIKNGEYQQYKLPDVNHRTISD